MQFAKLEIEKARQKKVISGKKNVLTLKSKDHMMETVMKSKDPWFFLFCTEWQPDCQRPIVDFITACGHLEGLAKCAFID